MFVTLREPSTLQYLKIQEAWKTQDESRIITDFYEIFADLIIDHSLYHTEAKKMSNKEVTDLLFGKFEAITEIMRRYYEFLGETKKKSQTKKEK